MYHSIVLKNELEILPNNKHCYRSSFEPKCWAGKKLPVSWHCGQLGTLEHYWKNFQNIFGHNDFVISLFFYFGALCIGGIMSVHFAKQDQRLIRCCFFRLELKNMAISIKYFDGWGAFLTFCNVDQQVRNSLKTWKFLKMI